MFTIREDGAAVNRTISPDRGIDSFDAWNLTLPISGVRLST
jgi:hypothetical protein